AMTAHAYEEEKRRCLDAGMNDHIAKPVDPQLLVRVLNRWLVAPMADAGSAGVSPAIAPVDAAEDLAPRQLPDTLPPFNIAAALVRVNGKAPLLRKLIVSFGEQYGDVCADLRGRIAAGLVPDARRVAHSLKGVAGSLELIAVQAIAAGIERALAEDEVAGALAAINDLEEEIGPALKVARGLANAGAGAKVGAQAAHDPALVAAAAERLRDLLRRRSLGARSAFAAYADALGLSPEDRAQHRLHRAIEALDYETALAVLDEGDAPASAPLAQPEGTAP
ncbi:MAG TPA: Hpt domain-containing protein, partial [Novosphingobium sp.]|nr:Hpt domain-containing protein [Novosphingobium sp.]